VRGQTGHSTEENYVRANVGSIDRGLRVLVGFGLLALVFMLEGNARWWGLVGIVPLMTGLFRFCPAYALFGFNSCPIERRNA
jgi:hypothetical protein